MDPEPVPLYGRRCLPPALVRRSISGACCAGSGATIAGNGSVPSPSPPRSARPSAIFSTQASFRDPAGSVLISGDRVFRIVGPAGRDSWEAFSTSPGIREFETTGKVIATHPLDDAAAAVARAIPAVDETYRAVDGQLLIEHEHIGFPSYPYEWAPEMLEVAGILTLETERPAAGRGMWIEGRDALQHHVPRG